VAEAIHCPSCSTRYRLRPERLKPVIRRAKCFSCGGLFPVEAEVRRLLAMPAPGEPEGYITGDLDAPPLSLEPLTLEPLDLETLPQASGSPSLSLGDLEGTEAEILEKTLVDFPPSLPETKPAAPAFPPEITETTLSGYTSARDAIDKLFAGAPALPTTGAKSNPEPRDMDMEATLSALESTLGGSSTPTTPAPLPQDEELMNAASSSTLRLSQEDLKAALAATPAPAAPAPAAAPAPVMEEPTVALRASDLALTPPAPRAFAPLAEAPDAGSELLRLKIGEEIYGGLTMAQLIAWVEEGRIIETHLVARQHSENWLEAHKVPGLRPVFERLRRERSGGAPSLDIGTGEIAPKKSLFGGLFGKH